MSGTKVRVGLIAVVMTALGLVALSEMARAADELPALDKIAKALASGDKAAAAKQAAALAKKIEEIDEVMNGMKLRDSKKKVSGFGIGDKPGAITPDGIELKFNTIEEKGLTAAALKKEKDALLEAAYRIAAIAEVAHTKGWEKDAGKKTKKAWLVLSKEMRESSMDVAESIKGGDVAKIKAATTKMNGVCTACHGIFK